MSTQPPQTFMDLAPIIVCIACSTARDADHHSPMTPAPPASQNPSNENDTPSEHADDDGEEAPTAPKEVLEVLRNRTRRTIVKVLLGESDLTLVTLASRVAGETETPLADVVIELHDVHLPKLTDSSLVDYDPGTGDISLDLPAETVEAVLEELEDDSGYR